MLFTNIAVRCATNITTTNIAVRSTFKTRKTYHFYKYYGARHLQNAKNLLFLQILRCAAPTKREKLVISTNIAVRCTFKLDFAYFIQILRCAALEIFIRKPF